MLTIPFGGLACAFGALGGLLAAAFAFAFFEVPAFFVLLLFAPACEARFGATFFLAAVGAVVRLATLGLADLVVAPPFFFLVTAFLVAFVFLVVGAARLAFGLDLAAAAPFFAAPLLTADAFFFAGISFKQHANEIQN